MPSLKRDKFFANKHYSLMNTYMYLYVQKFRHLLSCRELNALSNSVHVFFVLLLLLPIPPVLLSGLLFTIAFVDGLKLAEILLLLQLFCAVVAAAACDGACAVCSVFDCLCSCKH